MYVRKFGISYSDLEFRILTKFRIFDKIKFGLDEILYSGAFEVADYESEFKIQKFEMANPNGRPKCKKLLDLEEILYSRVLSVYPGHLPPPPPPPFTLAILLHTWVQPFPTALLVVRVTVKQRRTTLI